MQRSGGTDFLRGPGTSLPEPAAGRPGRPGTSLPEPGTSLPEPAGGAGHEPAAGLPEPGTSLPEPAGRARACRGPAGGRPRAGKRAPTGPYRGG